MASLTLANAILLSTPAAATVDVVARQQQKLAGRVCFPARRRGGSSLAVRASGPSSSTPQGLSDKMSESIKQAEETCKDETATGECAAAWDEVEELSAAASHARDKLKDSSDPLEKYCKDNPEADECRTYDN